MRRKGREKCNWIIIWKTNKKLLKKEKETVFKVIWDCCLLQATLLKSSWHWPWLLRRRIFSTEQTSRLQQVKSSDHLVAASKAGTLLCPEPTGSGSTLWIRNPGDNFPSCLFKGTRTSKGEEAPRRIICLLKNCPHCFGRELVPFSQETWDGFLASPGNLKTLTFSGFLPISRRNTGMVVAIPAWLSLFYIHS